MRNAERIIKIIMNDEYFTGNGFETLYKNFIIFDTLNVTLKNFNIKNLEYILERRHKIQVKFFKDQLL